MPHVSGKLNILLTTYGYYPYNFGGTEVYVSGLAHYLFLQGHSVTIIAGVPDEAFKENALFYEDAELKIVKYQFEQINIIGAIMKHTTTLEIYRKYRSSAEPSWLAVLNKLPQLQWDILHFHAHTSAFGQNIVQASKIHSPNIKVFCSYHLPVSCVKNTLMYGNQLKECLVKPSANICTACYLMDKKHFSPVAAKAILYLLPTMKYKHLPFAMRLKFLVQQSINAFQEIINSVDRWHVFSKQIHDILLLNGVQPNNIFLLQHGVDNVFLEKNHPTSVTQKNKEAVTFLYAGRFEKVKGFATLLKAWCTLKEVKERKLEIIGEMQSDDAEITDVIKIAANRKDIRWHGKKSQPEIAAIMQYVHCTIIPSEWVEIGPLVFHEAISKGSDVIAADIGGCKVLAALYSAKSNLFTAGNIESLQHAIGNFKYSGISLPVITQSENYKTVEDQYRLLITAK